MSKALVTFRALIATTLLAGAAAQAADSGQVLAQRAGESLIGKPAPALSLTTIDGKRIDLGRLYGHKAIYLKFWATWCVPCRQQMPHFERTFEHAGSDLAVIGINAGFDDTVADVRQYQRTVGIKMPIVIDDGRVAESFHLRVTPQHVVIGRDGRVLYIGHLADEQLDYALKAARIAVRGGASADRRNPSSPPSLKRYVVGDVLPTSALTTIDDREITWHDAHDHRPIALVFLSPWCEGYLAQSRPTLAANCRDARVQVDTAAKSGRIRWIGIASGLWATADDLRDYQKEHDIRIPLILDESGDVFHAFDVMQVPTVLFADEQGRLVSVIAGGEFANREVWMRALAAAETGGQGQ